jgi:hypothetical protein
MFQPDDVEVDQQTLLDICDPEVRPDLGAVNREDAVDGLELDQDLVFDDQVSHERAREETAVVREGQCNLTLERETQLLQFVASTVFVHRFK